MKKIVGYRILLGVHENTGLQELKLAYRNLIKEWHPDKVTDNPEMQEMVKVKSKHIIEAYHFLVSIAPETRENTISEFTHTTTSIGIIDFEYKSEILKINFLNGNSYEWFGIRSALYHKMVNAPSPARFARRHIYNSFPYRTLSKAEAV